MKSVVEQRFFHEFAFDNNALKTFVGCRRAQVGPQCAVDPFDVLRKYI